MYKIILHATDLSKDHFAICKQSVEIARRFSAKLHLLHVIEPPSSLQLAQGLGFAEVAEPDKDDALAVMAVVGETFAIPKKQQHVEIGSIKMHIASTVKELGCNLVIIGSHHANGLPAFLGNTARAIIDHSPCDVLTLRSEITKD